MEQLSITKQRAKELKKQEDDIKEVLSQIKNKLVVMSGKGGVGKSSVAANIAVGLAMQNYKVGLLDIDIHGPSIPKILGVDKKRSLSLDNRIIPVDYSENLKIMSVGFLLETDNSALIWRGPMKTNLIKQFISGVIWDKLDYLIIDSPPGTGDEPLTVAQTVEGAQAVVVTTPQDVAILDVKKSITFCRALKMPILGLVENMSGMVCLKCGEEINVFKKDGGRNLSEYMEVPFLGKIPLSEEMVVFGDKGKSVFSDCLYTSHIKSAYQDIVSAIATATQEVKNDAS